VSLATIRAASPPSYVPSIAWIVLLIALPTLLLLSVVGVVR
jgi:hypothetical protein